MTWTASAFESSLERFPALGRNVLTILSHEGDEALHRVRELATEHVEQRIARAIGRVWHAFMADADGEGTLPIPLSRQDVAEMTGATLFTVSRVMTEWDKVGLAKSGRQRFIVLDRAGLVAIAEGRISGGTS
jgi:CRP-like cAMP-binding protein